MPNNSTPPIDDPLKPALENTPTPAPTSAPTPTEAATPTAAQATPVAPVATTSPAESPTGTLIANEEELKALIDLPNLYLFGLSEGDRSRLIAQTLLFSQYLREKARRMVHNSVANILDLGCGEGQLTRTLAKLFPNAHVIGMDQDPKAIEAAKKQLVGLESRQIEFIVGDMRTHLPPGPCDLVYASLSLSYIPQLSDVLKAILKILSPGGTLWIKDGHPHFVQTENPTFAQLTTLVMASLFQMGVQPYLSAELPEILKSLGYTDIEMVRETYQITNDTTYGRIALSVILGGFYNFRKMVAQKQNMPEEEVVRLHKELSDHTDTLKGLWTLGNVLARRPKA